MSASVIEGKAFAEGLRARIAAAVPAFVDRVGRKPGLDVVLVGDDPASRVYVRFKGKATVEAGMESFEHVLPESTSQAELVALVHRLNGDDRVDGILVQLPLPSHIDDKAVIDAIDPAKDVDGFSPYSVGLLVQGRARLAPCTPSGVIEMLDRSDIEIRGRRAVVIGRSEIVGKPMAMLLLQRDATVTICHSKTPDLPAVAREADILVAAIGRTGFVTSDFVKPGATVVDVGINRVTDEGEARRLFGDGATRLQDFLRKGSAVVGDVHPDVAERAGALTPVPGGVGPLTIAMLLKNTVTAAEGRLGS